MSFLLDNKAQLIQQMELFKRGGLILTPCGSFKTIILIGLLEQLPSIASKKSAGKRRNQVNSRGYRGNMRALHGIMHPDRDSKRKGEIIGLNG